jgi:nicotinamidase/pyrazinamidase
MHKNLALLIVDVQNDFCPNGALAVPDGDRVVEPLNRLAASFAAAGLPVLASRDWHPQNTGHFREFGGMWPPHCMQNSNGAAFHPALRLPESTLIISKGSDPDTDAYSAFDGLIAGSTPLADILANLHIRRLYIGGLATDYCVLNSVQDARKNGFEVTVLADAIAGVDITAGDSEKALEKMRLSGVVFCTTDEAIGSIANTFPAA